MVPQEKGLIAMSRITDITIILDRSGSMSSIKEATVKGINAFMDDVNKVPGEGVWSLVQFDDPDSARGAKERFPHVVFENVSSAHLPRLEPADFKPRGSTALVDAVCLTIGTITTRVLAVPEADRPKVMVVVMTDGLENASREFTSARLREMVAEAQSVHGWEFLYLGANQDAFSEAGKYGMAKTGNVFNFSATDAGAQGALNAGARNARSWKLDGNDSAEDLLGSPAPDDPSKEPTP
jgi:hypothetical protein